MIAFAAAMLLAGADQASLRHTFAECLTTASTRAKNQKVAPEGFIDFARAACDGSAEPFRSALTETNVSHGMSRKAAASDAASQVDDYYSERLENYKIEIEPLPPLPKKAD